MRTKSINRVNMIRTVLNYCTDNAAKTAAIAAFAGVKTSADNKLVLIEQLDQLVMQGTKGVTLNTKLLRQTMSGLGLKCGHAVSAYAATIQDSDLLNAVSLTESDLNALTKEEAANACQAIHDAADEHIANAGAYGYVAADVTDLQTSIDLYRTSMTDPRDRIADISQAIGNIETLIREVIDDLFKKKMDKMVKTLEGTEADFVGGYFMRREIIDLGATTAKVRGTVKTEDGVLPLANVKFTVYEAGTATIVKQVITDAEGKYKTGPVSAGDYDFKWELNGYQTVTEQNVHISPGKEVKRNIKMTAGSGSAFSDSGTVNGGMLAFINPGFTLDSNTPVVLKNNGTTTLQYYFEATVNAYPSPSTPITTVAPGQTINTTAGLVGYVPTREKLHVTTPGPGNGVWAVEIG